MNKRAAIEPVPMNQSGAILVINCGSSSVKFALFSDNEVRLRSGAVERIGLADGRVRVADRDGGSLVDERRTIADHAAALTTLLATLERDPSSATLSAVGHRVVHGGADCDCPLPVTAALEARLRRLVPLAPLHLPHNLAGIAAVRTARPELPQIACFDTAFHHSLPRLARLTALHRKFYDEGIRRYGFHGFSYEYVVDVLRRNGVDIERERIIVAHLGNGASMCALKGGRSVETTMGFSALAGLPMGTRCGDLDPGIVLHLLAQKGMTVEQVQRLLYEDSGLRGISGRTGDMQDLLGRSNDPAAVEAIDLYCYQARRHLGALTATLGGFDRLVFTGGIGANAALIRTKICADLGYLGIALDEAQNVAGKRVISAAGSRVVVEAFPTDEELMIARHVRQVLALRPPAMRAAT